MSIVDRVAASREEKRAIGGVPWADPWSSPNIPFSAGGPVHPSQAGPGGQDRALSLAPVYAAARIIADAVASLPLNTYRGPPGPGPAARVPSGLFAGCPSAVGTMYDWVHMSVVSLVLQGNAWGFITSRDGMGFPRGIEWLAPQRVSVQEDETQPWNPLRAKIYFYGREMDRKDLLHVRAFSMPGRILGLSPLGVFKAIIENGHHITDYSSGFFRGGGFPGGTFKNSELEIDAEQAAEIRRRVVSSLRRHEPLVYGRDWDYNAVSVPPNEAQFVEAARLNATQWGAIYGIPPERIGGSRGDSMTYSNQEQGSISLLVDTVRPWLVRLEHAFFDLLPAGQFARFNSDAMLKVTTKERHEIYQIDRQIGLKTIDELRALDDLEPLPDGAGKYAGPLEVQVAEARAKTLQPGGPVQQTVGGGRAPSAGGPPAAPPSPSTPGNAIPSPNGGQPVKAG